MTRPTLPRRCPSLLLSMSLFVVASSAGHAQPRWPPQHGRENLAARLLGAHNSERAPLGSPPLTWDPVLAAAADAYAAELAATGRWGHSKPHQRVNQGENLWTGTRGAFSLEVMIGNWASEKSMFRPGLFPNVSNTGKWEDVGHYVQIVWPGTRRVGCAVRSSARDDFLVCRYADPGNVVGEPIPGPVRIASSQP